MIPKQFVNTYYLYALEVEKQTGIFAITILARAAIESGWGKRVSGNNFFGIKDTDGINGNEQLITTTEYIHSPKATFPVILKIIPFGNKIWKYLIKDYFRKYDTVFESFLDFANFLKRNNRYKNAITKTNHLDMSIAICKAGYATDPASIKLVTAVSKMITNLIPK